MRILVIHGPNLELLGTRAPEHYGRQTLDDVNAALAALGRELGAAVDAVQHNEEEALVAAVRKATGRYDGLIVNPACYTHTSTALAAALAEAGLPYVEVHLSNPYAREEFRHRSYVAAGAAARVMGFKGDSYLLALRGLVRRLAAPDA
jgi:3-dehydroquinate dehydratase-2